MVCIFGDDTMAHVCLLKGRVMFVGYNDYTLRAWDTLKETHLAMWIGHQDRLSHVQMSPDGMALCTSSWDGTLAVSCHHINNLTKLFVVVRYGHNNQFITEQSTNHD